MGTKHAWKEISREGRYEDADYGRYHGLFSDPVTKKESVADEWNTEALLEDDAINAAEEGFLRGYGRRSYEDTDWV